MTALGEVMVILLLVFLPQGAAQTFLSERGLPKPTQEPQTVQEVVACVTVGPGRSLRVDDVPTQLDALAEVIGEATDGALVELRTLAPADDFLAWDTRAALKAQGFSLRLQRPHRAAAN